jgi:uncharacterized membrane protein
MSDNLKSILIGILVAIIFVVCIALVVIGQKNTGPQGLLTMLVGLAGLLVLLGIYNSKYK